MDGKVKNWLLLAASGWALLAFVAWNYESSCGMFLSGACWQQHWDRVRDFVLFRWLYDFQPLLAGLAAIAGGTFVLKAARDTAVEQRRLQSALARKNAVTACSVISDEFRDARIPMSGDHNFTLPQRESHEYFPQFPLLLPTLHAVHPMLGSVVSASKRDVQLALSKGPLANGLERKRAAATSSAMYYLLVHATNNIDADGTFDMDRVKFVPASSLKKDLEALGVNTRSIIGIREFFDWDQE